MLYYSTNGQLLYLSEIYMCIKFEVDPTYAFLYTCIQENVNMLTDTQTFWRAVRHHQYLTYKCS